MTQRKFRGRDAIINPPVSIRPLVIVDLLIGGLQLVVAVSLLIMSGNGTVAQGGANFVQVAATIGAVFLLISLAVISMGLLLFTRKVWAYWISLIGHALMFLFQGVSLAGTILQAVIGRSTRGEISMALGCNGFVLLLFGLCIYHAWKLIRADTRRKESIRLAAEEAEIEAAPGWDQGPKQP